MKRLLDWFLHLNAWWLLLIVPLVSIASIAFFVAVIAATVKIVWKVI